MNTKMMVVMAAVLAITGANSTVLADEPIFKAEVGMNVSSASRETPDEALVYGTVTLSAKGEIKVIWDGVTLGLGDYSFGATQARALVAANLPAVYLDLQKIFGVKWMDSIRLTFAAGSYATDAITGKTDITLGQISVNLSQTVFKTKTVEWTMSEGAGVSGYFSRKLREWERPFEAVPVNFSLNTKVVASVSSEAVVALSMGAFANIATGINQNAGFQALVLGGFIAPSVTFNKTWEVGARYQVMEMIQIAGGNGLPAFAHNVSGYVKYMFTEKKSLRQHAIELNVGTMDDGIVRDREGRHTRATFVGLKYSVSF